MKAFVRDLKAGATVASAFVLSSLVVRTSNKGPYLTFALVDRTGSINAVWWGPTDEEVAAASSWRFVHIAGAVTTYAGALQVNVSIMRPLMPSDVEMSEFEACAPMTPDELAPKMDALIANLTDDRYRQLLSNILTSRLSEHQPQFINSPAAAKFHHAYRHGLLQHSMEVAEIALNAAIIENSFGYPDPLDIDVVITGAILHDIGKVFCYEGPESAYALTDAGGLLDHVYVGTHHVEEEMKEMDFTDHEILQILHIMLSHHGRREWGSPVCPQTPEALVVHHADMISAGVNMMREARKGKGRFERHPGIEGGHVYNGHPLEEVVEKAAA